ncbi:hypothetical protein K1T71_008144 [Dendrolimus kikuchii]|uniref:Uncharacterized protein n=1 Tax=Dendrolimus kikuchii TaxID=765133 RepID=A0ACC1CWX2_9NEOP|nr:hypothetical protein K1T71_008144 [Dendrolimus kikuchii]
MSSPSAVVCREIFDENSQPSAEEISEYALQLGIDPESECHLLPLARDGLMQALPAPWKAYFDEKLQTHYYYNEDTKKTQWEHPLDKVYKELVKKARDASMHDDTCASVQELPTSEENTKNLERVETKVESDEELSTDSENHQSDVRDSQTLTGQRRLTPLGRPPLSPLTRFDKKLGDIRISPLRRSVDGSLAGKPTLMRNISDRELLSRQERPNILFKQQSEIIDLKMKVLNSQEEENFSPLLTPAKVEKGLLAGKGNMFFKVAKSDLPSPDNDKSLPLDSMTKSDPPKGILREKISDTLHRKAESVLLGRPRQTASFEEDRKSVRFKLENVQEPTLSPGSNSSSEQNDGQSSIISAAPALQSPVNSSSLVPFSPVVPSSPITVKPIAAGIVLSPLVTRPPLPPRPNDSPREKSLIGEERDSLDSESRESRGTSPRRRVLRPPAADYIKPDLFQKNFQKISDLVRPGDIDTPPVNLEEPAFLDKQARPRSPMIPQKNKISINLMESIESETSIDSPDREFANLDLNDLDESNDTSKDKPEENAKELSENLTKAEDNSKLDNSVDKSSKIELQIPQIKVPNLDFLKTYSDSEDSKKTSTKEEISKNSKSFELSIKSPQLKVSPTSSLVSEVRSPRLESNLGSELRSPRLDFGKPWGPLSTFKPMNKAVIAPQIKTSDSSVSLGKSSPRLDGVILSQGKSTDNVVVVYQFETQEETTPRIIRSPLIPDMGNRDFIERNKADEKRRLELAVQKELENIRVEFLAKERKLRGELQVELKEAEDRFAMEKRVRINEQVEKHKRELEETLSTNERNHQQALQKAKAEMEERYNQETQAAEKQYFETMEKLKEDYKGKLLEQQYQLETENERALSELRDQLNASFSRERARMIEENKTTIETLREEHTARVTDLRHDYRAELSVASIIWSVHRRHPDPRGLVTTRGIGYNAGVVRRRQRLYRDLYECRSRSSPNAAHARQDTGMSIERRNKRREMSMTTGSETEKSNSHNKGNQSLERCKEVNETSVSAVIEPEPNRRLMNNNTTMKYNDNETSYSESNAHKPFDNNNDNWKDRRETVMQSEDTSQVCAVKQQPHRRTAVAFREPPRRRRDKDRDIGANTDCQDSSDPTTADEKPKETINGHGRRRCFTRLKSASTSRLNYSPKRGEGWSSPLESLRQQLRKLDDLEDQFPDLACQPAYSLRYPFTELGTVTAADTPELEFVRHRALVEREGMRRARAVLKRRRAALRETRASLSPHRAPSEATTSEASSGSEAHNEVEAGGAVLRSLRALHADVRDIWRALDARRPVTASPETSSCNAQTSSQARMTLSAPDQVIQDTSDGGVSERARGLRAWLQTAP